MAVLADGGGGGEAVHSPQPLHPRRQHRVDAAGGLSRSHRHRVGALEVGPVVPPLSEVGAGGIPELHLVVAAGQPPYGVAARGVGPGVVHPVSGKIEDVHPDALHGGAGGVGDGAADQPGGGQHGVNAAGGLSGGDRHRVGGGEVGAVVPPLCQVGAGGVEESHLVVAGGESPHGVGAGGVGDGTGRKGKGQVEGFYAHVGKGSAGGVGDGAADRCGGAQYCVDAGGGLSGAHRHRVGRGGVRLVVPPLAHVGAGGIPEMHLVAAGGQTARAVGAGGVRSRSSHQVSGLVVDPHVDVGQGGAGRVGDDAANRPGGRQVRVDAAGGLPASHRHRVGALEVGPVVPPLEEMGAGRVAEAHLVGASGQVAHGVDAGGIRDGAARPTGGGVESVHPDTFQGGAGGVGDGAADPTGGGQCRVGNGYLAGGHDHLVGGVEVGPVVPPLFDVDLARVVERHLVAVGGQPAHGVGTGGVGRGRSCNGEGEVVDGHRDAFQPHLAMGDGAGDGSGGLGGPIVRGGGRRQCQSRH